MSVTTLRAYIILADYTPPIIESANPKGLTDRHLRQAALFAVSQLTSALRGERLVNRTEVNTAESVLREFFARATAAMTERDRERREIKR